MLSYQLETEENFYKGIFVTTSFELGEFTGDDRSSTNFIFSINRNSRLQDLLDSFLIRINTELRQQIPVKDKIDLLDNFLKTATEYRLNQQVIFRKEDNLVYKCVANQNLGFMNSLINELGNKKSQLKQSYGGNDNKSKTILHFNLKDKKQTSEKQILELYKRLKNKKFIEGTATQFKAVFDLDTFNKPIIWMSEKANELLYFYFKLENTGIINNPRNKHQILKHHFIKKDELPFGENFKQLYYDIKNDYEQPLRAKEIDVCFNSTFTFRK